MKLLSLALLLWLGAAGADLQAAGGRGAMVGTFGAPEPPVFVNGRMAVLLTNTDGFSAHAVLSSGKTELASGELLGRGSRLLFAGTIGPVKEKRSRTGGVSFIWDTATNGGYLLSEPLQGYAPISSAVRVTNLVARAPGTKSAPTRIEGHRCEEEEATIASSDGSTSVYQVWRATDWKGLPIRISSGAEPAVLTLNLSKVKLTVPSADLFQPPDGFTKYDSADTMMNEHAIRQQTLRQGRPTLPGEGGGDLGGQRGRGGPGG